MWAVLCLTCALALAGCFRQPPEPDPSTGDGGMTGDGRAIPDGSPGTNHNIMFVSAGEFGPPWDSGSPPHAALANAFCNDQARQNNLLGDYAAWLSFGSGENAADTLRGLPNAIDWYRPDGTLFAHTVDDILASPLALAPVIDQFGADVTKTVPGVEVATGTAPDGTYDGGTSADCPSGSIEIGYPGHVDSSWTAGGETTCNGAHLRLYCFSFGL